MFMLSAKFVFNIGDFLRIFDCIRKILNYAKRLNIITLIPSIPKIERHDKNSYAPYTKDEVNAITKELRNCTKTQKQFVLIVTLLQPAIPQTLFTATMKTEGMNWVRSTLV